MMDLCLTSVDKFYGENHVLCDINLTIPGGEFVVIVGPSGCGKTTLLRVIAGLEQIDDGTIEMDGVVVNDLPSASRNVAMVFQSYALYPHMTVTENLAFSLELEGLTRVEISDRIDEVFRMLSLAEYGDRKPSELSGGQRQRVALGRALVRKPKLFLFDEPLSNLDAALRMNTRIEIANIHRTLGTSILYVTHDQTEAMTLADRIVVMRRGRIEQVGSPLELYNDPVNQFVAGFLGSPAMNFIDSDLLSVSGAAIVGLRPQHLRLATAGRLKGRILHFERLGSDTHLVLDVGRSAPVIARLVGQQEFGIDAPVTLDFDDDDALWFDAEGRRVGPTT
ncbi:ABC transporter ATP-binding protein [Boseongicola aestuarii]|uniref:Trehalose import ATP-binding protein SugC n=1 Tax=Boseongicola aestuarii TaxID=1470561 RepID=A0A238IWX1_9RHOB|nr:ABC transporter ATP-binding protein [Boseongicola aestuarii]SMX22543.1 Trehalose import ATP-binding protein SugC [Boseongicola aestuarii]